jgi:CHASE2 domain-containing sensor protein
LFSDLTFVGRRIDNFAYDIIYQFFPPADWNPHSSILAIDEATYAKYGGQRQLRPMLVDALNALAEGHPKAVAIDITLGDRSDPKIDDALETAMQHTPNFVLPCQYQGKRWELPIERFRKYAKGIGHVHVDPKQPHHPHRNDPRRTRRVGARPRSISHLVARPARHRPKP